MTPLAQEWIDAATEDLKVARLIQEHAGPVGIACFHSQQAAEKLLKGFLQEQSLAPPRTHSLPYLLGLCLRYAPELQPLENQLQRLDTYYIDTRYPPGISPVSAAEAVQAIATAEQIEQSILALLTPPPP